MTTPVELIAPPSPPPPPAPPLADTDIIDSDSSDEETAVVLDYLVCGNHTHPRTRDYSRPQWSSRWTYTCGALLSIPASQLWRGASLLGGSISVYASLMGLLLAICVIGLPLHLLELAWGHKYQVGTLGIWQLPHFGASSSTSRKKRQRRRWTGLGVAGMVVGMVYSSVCMAILTWSLHALVDTWTSSGIPLLNRRSLHEERHYHDNTNDDKNPWLNHNHKNYDSSSPLQRQQLVEEYWVEQVVGQSTVSYYDMQPTRLVYENVLYTAILWTVVALTSSLGIRQLGRITLVTTSTSLLLLMALFGGSLLIPTDTDSSVSSGSTSSVWEDFATSIDQDDVLSESIVQTLYITGILLGIQSAYASYRPKQQAPTVAANANTTNATEEPIPKICSLILAIHTLLVFATGYVLSVAVPSHAMPVYANTFWNHSLRILLCHWPAAFGTHGILWVRLLYITFVLLGIQFPMAVVTAVGTVLRDDRTSTVARWKVSCLSCMVGFAVSLIFCTDAGLLFLDTIDYYLTLSLLLVGFLTAFAAGWMYNMEDQLRSYGIWPILFSILWNFMPVVVAAAVWFGLSTDEQASDHHHRMWLGLFGGLIVFLLFFMLAFVAIRRSYEQYVARCMHTLQNNGAASRTDERILHPRDYYLEFSFGNVEALKRDLEASMGCSLPQVWYIFLKRVVPHLLLLVFLKRLLMMVVITEDFHGNNDTDNNDSTDAPQQDYVLATVMAFGSYGGYPMEPFQVAGMTVFGLVAGVFVLGFVCPNVYAPLVPPPTQVFINRRDTMEDEEEEVTQEESSSSSSPDCVNLPDISELPHIEDPLEVMAPGNTYNVEIR